MFSRVKCVVICLDGYKSDYRLKLYAEGGLAIERNEPGIGWVVDDDLSDEMIRWATLTASCMAEAMHDKFAAEPAQA